MPWQCRLITKEQKNSDEYEPQYGDVCFAPWIDWDLSPDYLQNHKDKRPPIIIYVPDTNPRKGTWICIDQKHQSSNGWVITGEVPIITVMPSINAIGSYHGWLKDGVLTDDIEGRKY